MTRESLSLGQPLNVLFLIGSFEPERSGVTDYVVQLSKALEIRGVQSACIALNDQLVVSQSPILDDASGIRCIRFPAAISFRKRCKYLREVLHNSRPDNVSLQFVPYSFNAKGLPFQLMRMADIIRPYNTHILFHELWLPPNHGLKQTAIGVAQREIIRRLPLRSSTIRCEATFSKNAERLRQIGVSCSVVPIFSNIPVVKIEKTKTPNNHSYDVTFFGKIPGGVRTQYLIDALSWQASTQQQAIRLAFIGRSTIDREYLIAQLHKRKLDDDRTMFEIVCWGQRNPKEISGILSITKVGFSHASASWIMKSGVAHAFAEHRVAIWAPFDQSLSNASTIVGSKMRVFQNLGCALEAKPYAQTIQTVDDCADHYTRLFGRQRTQTG